MREDPAMIKHGYMNEICKFNSSEYAKMLVITTSALRKKIKGQLQDLT